jgi:hypothetical protein
MIPAKTIEIIGVGQAVRAIRFKAHDDYVLDGVDLNDLSALSARMGIGPAIGGDEMRDWQNRLALMLSQAIHLTA